MARKRNGFGLTFVGRFLVVFTGLASASLASPVGNDAEAIVASMRKAAGISALKNQTGDLVIRGAIDRLWPRPPQTRQPTTPSKVSGTKFVSNAKSPERLEVRRAKTGQLLVHPKIDGQSLGWFVFDTGTGGTVIHAAVAARLKLKRLSSVGVVTAFASSQASLNQANSLELGPVVIDKPFLVTMDLGFLQGMVGKDVVGLIGYDLLSRCVAQVNLSESSIQLYDPRTYRLTSGRWEKLVFDSDIPIVKGKFDRGEGLFRIDVGATGLAGNVVFHSPTVTDLKLLEGRKVKDIQLAMKRAAQGKIAWFELGGHRFGNPNAVFALDANGPFGDAYTTGNVGVNLLRAFRIVLDYPHERVALVSSRQSKK